MRKFRVHVCISPEEGTAKRYCILIREEWKTVQCLEEHLKILFGLTSCEIELDDAILPSLESIDIIEPNDVLTVRSKKIRNITRVASHQADLPKENGIVSLPACKASKNISRKEIVQISRSVGHVMSLLKNDHERLNAENASPQASPMEHNSCPSTEASLMELCSDQQSSDKKRKRKRKKKVHGELNQFEVQNGATLQRAGPSRIQHVRFDNDGECSNYRDSDDECESETIENPLNKYLQMAKTSSKFKFTKNGSETDDSPPKKTPRNKHPETHKSKQDEIVDSEKSGQMELNISDLPTQNPQSTSTKVSTSIGSLVPEEYPVVNDARENDILLFKEQGTEKYLLGQVSDRFTDGIRIDLMTTNEPADVPNNEPSRWIRWDSIVDARLISSNTLVN